MSLEVDEPQGNPASHWAGVLEEAQASHTFLVPGGGINGGAGPLTPAAADDPG